MLDPPPALPTRADPPYYALRDDILLSTKHIFGDSLFGRVRTFIFSGQVR